MTIVLLIVLLIASAVFVTAELAVLSSRKGRLQQAAERGNAHAAAALALAEEPSRFLSTVQIGITLIAICNGALVERAFQKQVADAITAAFLADHPKPESIADPIATILVILPIAYLSLVFGELIPKRLALLYPERIARAIAQPLQWLSVVATPAVWAVSASAEAILRVLGVKDIKRDEVTEEDIKGMVVQAAESGAVHHQEREIVERAFRLGDRKVKALMIPRADIEWLDADASSDRLRVAVATSYHSHFPVAKGSLDHVMGIVHVKDVIKHGLISETVNLSELVQPALFIPEATPAYKLLDTFRKSGHHIALVVDEYGALRGLVTLNDIVESLIGEVASPTDSEDALAVKRDDGSWLLDGGLPVDELLRILQEQSPGLTLPHDPDVATIGGLVMSTLGHIPHTGESFEREGFRYEIIDMDSQRIDKVLVKKADPKPLEP